MLVFVTSMRHPDNAANYDYNEILLRDTLNSIARQTSDDYIVYVVGNQEPGFELPGQAKFIKVDFPAPERVNGLHANREGFVRDKGTKVGVGLIAALEHSPDWVMIFDADDFLHRDLVSYVHTQPLDSPGWVIERGWIYSRSRNGYRRQDAFNRTCGTSYIVPFSAYDVPHNVAIDAPQDEIIAAFGDVLPNIMGAHRNAMDWHRQRGRVLAPLPFRGAVYHVDTGENHSGKALPGVVRPWDKKLANTFGVNPTRARMPTLWACLGPVAVLQSLWMSAKKTLGPLYRSVRRILNRASSDDA